MSAKGMPVSAAISPTADIAALSHETLKAIDSVHGDGRLPMVPLRNYAPKGGEQGSFLFSDPNLGGVSATLQIGVNARYPHLTLAHEIGHLIDVRGFGSGMSVCGSAPEFDAWRTAIDASAAVRRLDDAVAQRRLTGTYRGATYVIPLGAGWLAHIGYLLEWHELWARSYAQFVVVESGDAQLRHEFTNHRATKYSREAGDQWRANDFKPIRIAMRQLFTDRGWM